MGTPIVRPPPIRDRDDQFQRDSRSAIKALDSPGLRKVTVTGVALTTGTTLVPHQLGKIPVGWLVIDRNANAVVFRDSSVASTNDAIPLKASASVTVDIQFW